RTAAGGGDHPRPGTGHRRRPAGQPAPGSAPDRTSGRGLRGLVSTGADFGFIDPRPRPPRSARTRVGAQGARYMPAIVAIRCNPVLHAFAERLRAKGKRPKVVIAAVMRKLLLLAWTLVRTGQPFSPTHHLQLASA